MSSTTSRPGFESSAHPDIQNRTAYRSWGQTSSHDIVGQSGESSEDLSIQWDETWNRLPVVRNRPGGRISPGAVRAGLHQRCGHCRPLDPEPDVYGLLPLGLPSF